MKKSYWTSRLVLERAVDRLATDDEPVRVIARTLSLTERAVRRMIDRRHGAVHRERIKLLSDVVRRATGAGYDIDEDPAFSLLHAKLTHFCLRHPDALQRDIDPDRGCRFCCKRELRDPALPTQFPYCVVTTWSSSEGGFIAHAPTFIELRAVGDTIFEAKRELRRLGLQLIHDLIRANKPLPPSDLKGDARKGRQMAIAAIENANKPRKLKRKPKSPSPTKTQFVSDAPNEVVAGSSDWDDE